MYIEDFITSLIHNRVPLNAYDSGVVNSFYYQILNTTGFTEKQSALAVRISNRYSAALSRITGKDVTAFLTTPSFKYKIRKTVNTRSVKIVENEFFERVIETRFPFDESVIAEIRKFKNLNYDNLVTWDKEKSSWIFHLNEPNIKFVADLFKNTDADFDEEFQNYSDQLEKIIEDMDSHIPMLVVDNGLPKIVNAFKNMPEINTNDLLEAVFKARQYGVTMWSDEINQFIDTVDPSTRKFLNTGFTETSRLDADWSGIACLKNISKFLGPILFIIPGGSEFRKIEQIYTVLSDIGISNKNMSVLFRLSNETGKDFNDFVKNHQLNNTICADTQAVFVSGKLPKPLLESGIKFNSIVNVGFNNAHYTLKEYAKQHQNVVYFELEKNSKD